MENRQKIISILQGHKIIEEGDVKISPLLGGVSSDIWLLECGGIKHVVKQALPRLKVDAHWKANTRRNIAEQNFIQFLSSCSVGSVPKMVHADVEHSFFVMPYYGPPWQNWKTHLLQGQFDSMVTGQAALLLAEIHNLSIGRKEVAATFSNKEDFYDLRIEPYLIRTGQQHIELQEVFRQEAARLMVSEIALMHGDFSPKNMLINKGEMLLLDHEVACYGDPAFDLAFFINHLMLKNILFPKKHKSCDLPLVAWQSYFDHIRHIDKGKLGERSAKLWLMLLLARVDGKSPVEYLNARQKVFVRNFVHAYLLKPVAGDFLYLKDQFYHALLHN